MEENSLMQRGLLYEQSNASFQNKEYLMALKFYNEAINMCPEPNTNELAIIYQNRADVYEKLKLWTQVKNDCTKSLKYNPLYTKAYYCRAKSHEILNKSQYSLNDITMAVKLEIFQKKNIEDKTITDIRNIINKCANDAAKKHIAKRRPKLPSVFYVENYFQSLMFDPVMEELPKVNDPKGYIKAKIALEKEQYSEVISDCCEEIYLPESDSKYKFEAFLLRGIFYMFYGDFRQALQDLDAVINSEAEIILRAYALMKRATLNIHLDNIEAASADFFEAEKLSVNNVDLHTLRGRLYLHLGQYSKAAKDLQEALNLVPNHVVARVSKCHAEYLFAASINSSQLLEEAIKNVKYAMEQFPDHPECYRLMIFLLINENKFEEADSYFAKAIKLSPKTADMYAYYGQMILDWKHDFSKAAGLIRKAIALDRKCRIAYELLAKIEHRKRNILKAIKLFDKAISLAIFPKEVLELYVIKNSLVAEMNAKLKFSELGLEFPAMPALY